MSEEEAKTETKRPEVNPPLIDLSTNQAKRLIAISVCFGLIGGLAGGILVGRLGNHSSIMGTATKSAVVQETSAVTDVVKKVSPSVVSITAESTGVSFFGPQTQESAGTGMILTEDGLILTNKHVVPDDNATYSVFTADGKEYKNAKVVSRDPLNDIAFLRISAHGLKPIELGDSGSLVVGQPVVAIGNALGQFNNTATQGIISGLGRPLTAGSESGGESLTNLIQTDAAINPGNSGGPLVNLAGQVIGMNTAIAGNAQNIGFSIPIAEIKGDISSVESKGKVVRAYLGVRYVDITSDFASQNNLKVTSGAYVSGDNTNPAIVPGSPADKAGVQDGDIITKVNDQTIDPNHSLTSLISQRQVGDKVTLTVLRGDKTIALTATLEAAPAS